MNRRIAERIHLQIFLSEHNKDHSSRCMSLNLSPGGIYLNHLVQPFRRSKRKVGLEFELPGTSETIWACGEVCYDALDKYFHGTGVKFVGMAQFHGRLLRDFVLDEREKRLRLFLQQIRRNRRLLSMWN